MLRSNFAIFTAMLLAACSAKDGYNILGGNHVDSCKAVHPLEREECEQTSLGMTYEEYEEMRQELKNRDQPSL